MIPLNSDDKEREVEDSFLSSQGCLVLPNRMIFWKSSKLDLTSPLTSPPDSSQNSPDQPPSLTWKLERC